MTAAPTPPPHAQNAAEQQPLGKTEPPPAPSMARAGAPALLTQPLRTWLVMLGLFLFANGVSLSARPGVALEALLSRGGAPETAEPRSRSLARPLSWRRAPPPATETGLHGLAAHLVFTVGAAYVALGALSLLLGASAERRARLLGAQAFSTWSASQLLLSSPPPQLTAEDAARRFAVHATILATTTACSLVEVLVGRSVEAKLPTSSSE